MVEVHNRLYYFDSMLTTFEATVTRVCQLADGRHGVTLSQTAFYPTSGGQPHDTGWLNDVRVSDVVVEDGEVLHIVEDGLQVGLSVEGKVDWERRFDHMQQHCGQHILSAAFEHLYGWHTVGFHLSDASVTVDIETRVDMDELGDALLSVEALANRIVFEDRAITARFVTTEELASIPLWKAPKVTENIRIVTIEDFDYNACGGTHPLRTGQVGLVKITRVENARSGVRVSFLCGGRALQDYHTRVRALQEATRLLSTSVEEVPGAIRQLQLDFTDAKRTIDSQRESLTEIRARGIVDWWRDSNPADKHLICIEDTVSDAEALKQLAQALQRQFEENQLDATAWVLGEVGDRIHVFARASQTHDVNQSLKQLLTAWNGKGGGNARAAQGSLPKGPQVTVHAIAEQLNEVLSAQ